MAAQGQSQAEQTRRWELLLAAVHENLDDMPHLAADVGALEELLAEAKVVESRQDTLRAEAREKRAELQEITRRGNSVRGRIGAQLYGRFGFTAEILAKYGYRPRRRPGRRTPAPVPAPEAASVTPTTSTSSQ